MTEIGFGGWQIGGEQFLDDMPNGWLVGNDNECERLVIRAIDVGISFFDTAQSYGNGRSEKIIGRAVGRPGVRECVNICTKVPIDFRNRMDISPYNYLLNNIMQSCNNLNTEYIDILLLHNPHRYLITHDISGILQQLVEKGVIRSYGISSRTLEDLIYASDLKFGEYFEWNYSIFERRLDLHMCKRFHDYGQFFIGRSPLFRGIITEDFVENGPNNYFLDARAQLPRELLKWCHQKLINLQPIAHSFKLSVSEFAIAYSYGNGCLHVAIPGVSKPQHIDSIEKIMRLSEFQLESIRNINLGDELCFPGFF